MTKVRIAALAVAAEIFFDTPEEYLKPLVKMTVSEALTQYNGCNIAIEGSQ